MNEKMLREAREKGQVIHKGKPIRVTGDLLAETLQARREWGPIFNTFKEKNFQPRISHPAKLSFLRQATAERFHYHQACLTRPPEGSTKYEEEQLVLATAKTYQIARTIGTIKNLQQLTGKTAT